MYFIFHRRTKQTAFLLPLYLFTCGKNGILNFGFGHVWPISKKYV